jgi:membrane-associated protease RseP (regulator of RpoE activity)
MLVLLNAAPATFAVKCPEAKSAETVQYTTEYSDHQKKSSYLGVEVNDVEEDRVKALKLKEETGVEVTAVDEDAPAGKAGFKEHDVILSVNGTKMESEEQLRRTIRETPSGRTVDVLISRDGQQMTLKPTLASRDQMNVVVVPRIAPNVHVTVPPMPPMAPMVERDFAFIPPDVPDVRVYTNVRSVGALVENLTPQLRDFFGVKNGSGLLVRSVEKGSAAEAGGLKAGDVIVRVGDERVNDAGDWRRALRNKSGDVQFGIVRDKREQNVTVKLPARRETGALTGGEEFEWSWDDSDMEELRAQLKQQMPKITEEQKVAMLKAQKDWKKDFQAHQGEWQKSIAEAQKQSMKEQEKAMKDMKKEMEKMQIDLQNNFQNNFHFITFEQFE